MWTKHIVLFFCLLSQVLEVHMVLSPASSQSPATSFLNYGHTSTPCFSIKIIKKHCNVLGLDSLFQSQHRWQERKAINLKLKREGKIKMKSSESIIRWGVGRWQRVTVQGSSSREEAPDPVSEPKCHVCLRLEHLWVREGTAGPRNSYEPKQWSFQKGWSKASYKSTVSKASYVSFFSHQLQLRALNMCVQLYKEKEGGGERWRVGEGEGEKEGERGRGREERKRKKEIILCNTKLKRSY